MHVYLTCIFNKDDSNNIYIYIIYVPWLFNITNKVPKTFLMQQFYDTINVTNTLLCKVMPHAICYIPFTVYALYYADTKKLFY